MSSTLRFQKRVMVIADATMARTIEMAKKASRSSLPVLLCGESGTGKELIARFIHEMSERKSGPFVSVNCAAVPEGLMEAEFFGYERGAFTGAINRRIGKFEAAQGGTLLLDEISEMPFSLQAKLLRVLQENEIDRLGGKDPVPLDCRIIATTNRNPLQLIKEGRFREDLFYRLNVVRIECASLRGRPDAISILAQSFSDRIAERMGQTTRAIPSNVLEKLIRHTWPGNIRELQNAIERAILQAEEGELTPEHVDFCDTVRPPEFGSAGDSLLDLEQRHILETLEKTGGNRKNAAEKLGITARTLRNKLKTYSGTME